MKILSYRNRRFMPLIRQLDSANPGKSANDRLHSSGGRTCVHLGDEGQSLVEMALILPIVVAAMMGIFSIGFALWNYISLEGGVTQAAQYLADGGATNNTNGDTTLTDPCSSGFSQIINQTSGLDPNKIAVTYTLNGTPIGPYTGASANKCPTDVSLLGSGNITVSAQYPCNIGVYGFSFANCNLTATQTELAY